MLELPEGSAGVYGPAPVPQRERLPGVFHSQLSRERATVRERGMKLHGPRSRLPEASAVRMLK